ncbi:MAG: hypothetical protein QUV35_12230 [Hydrogenophaga sp.]|uniref:hypothetical protein n=1 Tax=Hydrogenophaga sp. TaxID=1904254 RepID=UPI00261C4BA8|nr:hypothetical protein [Hydrogenophaga sp.]MDM7943387.1 hypothetical protein [Hydrogenophaga sp.]
MSVHRVPGAVELLTHLIAVYRAEAEADWCNQSKDFHRAVAADAEWTLAKHTGAPLGKRTPHAKPTLKRAIHEVCRELVICCLADRRKRNRRGGVSYLAARRNAAELVGVPYAVFIKLYTGVIPKCVVLEGGRP